jgi:hypothetical protein
MRPNSTQLADCTERFLQLIAIREEIIAAKRAALIEPIDWTEDEKLLQQTAKACIQRLVPTIRGVSEISGSHWVLGKKNITIKYVGGIEITIPESYFGSASKEIKSRDKAIEQYNEEKAAACDQLETLARLRRVQGINSFRSYVRARWDALDADRRLSASTFRSYFDEFLASQTAFACKI